MGQLLYIYCIISSEKSHDIVTHIVILYEISCQLVKQPEEPARRTLNPTFLHRLVLGPLLLPVDEGQGAAAWDILGRQKEMFAAFMAYIYICIYTYVCMKHIYLYNIYI